ncbi:hypothetical protein YC2023_073978 [Brassica napus]
MVSMRICFMRASEKFQMDLILSTTELKELVKNLTTLVKVLLQQNSTLLSFLFQNYFFRKARTSRLPPRACPCTTLESHLFSFLGSSELWESDKGEYKRSEHTLKASLSFLHSLASFSEIDFDCIEKQTLK